MCEHPDFEANVVVNRLEDTKRFQLDLKVWCRECSLPFEFPEDLPIGIDLMGTARSVSGQELRIAIHPARNPDDWSDRSLM